MKHFILLFILLFTSAAFGQTVLIDMDKTKETQFREERNGQNLAHFNQFYFRFGAVLPPDEKGAPIVYGTSVDLNFGFRKKYKVSGHYALGWELEINWTDYKLKQSKEKAFPDSTLNKRERLDMSSFGLGLFQRLNFDPKRGNTIGKYIEVAIHGRFAYYELMRKNDLPDGSRVKAVISGLPYTLPFQANASVRLGIGHFALYANYRLTELFKSRYNYPSMPNLTAGIEIGLY